MNNLYNWHDEQMVKHKMLEVNRAVEQAHLLKDAGISQQSWLVRSVLALRNLLNARRKVFKDHRSFEHQSYQCEKADARMQAGHLHHCAQIHLVKGDQNVYQSYVPISCRGSNGVAVIASTSSPEPMMQFAISPADTLKVTPTLCSA